MTSPIYLFIYLFFAFTILLIRGEGVDRVVTITGTPSATNTAHMFINQKLGQMVSYVFCYI